MTSNRRNLSYIPKPLICMYTIQNRNEFAIGLEKDENFRAITKIGESYTRFVDAYNQKINDENEIDWKLELKNGLLYLGTSCSFCCQTIFIIIITTTTKLDNLFSCFDYFILKSCLLLI